MQNIRNIFTLIIELLFPFFPLFLEGNNESLVFCSWIYRQLPADGWLQTLGEKAELEWREWRESSVRKEMIAKSLRRGKPGVNSQPPSVDLMPLNSWIFGNVMELSNSWWQISEYLNSSSHQPVWLPHYLSSLTNHSHASEGVPNIPCMPCIHCLTRILSTRII